MHSFPRWGPHQSGRHCQGGQMFVNYGLEKTYWKGMARLWLSGVNKDSSVSQQLQVWQFWNIKFYNVIRLGMREASFVKISSRLATPGSCKLDVHIVKKLSSASKLLVDVQPRQEKTEARPELPIYLCSLLVEKYVWKVDVKMWNVEWGLRQS